MKIPIRDSVVVITGASTGIGRATACAFARRGATVLLASRQQEALEAALRECERLGGRGLAMPLDVTNAEAVEELADRTIREYGRLDVWVNNAAVSLFGRLEETPREAYERVLQTNLFGYVNGARAAIRCFREQGHGHLINLSSMVGHIGQPYTSAYVASKWAIRGLSECLRMELMDAPDIHVSTVLPASIDTPIFQHAGNYTGRPTKAMTPVYPPEQVADAIVRLVERPRREVFVGNAGRMLALLRSALPRLGERIMARQVEQDHFQQEGVAAPTPGNLFAPANDGNGSARAGWIEREHGSRPSPAIPAAAAAGLAAVAVPLAVVAFRRLARQPS